MLITICADNIKDDEKDGAYDTYGTERHANKAMLRSREKMPFEDLGIDGKIITKHRESGCYGVNQIHVGLDRSSDGLS